MAPLIAALALGGPPDLMPGIVLGLRLLLTLAAGVMLIATAAVLLDIAATIADRRLDRVAWRPYVDRMRRLVPEARAYVTYGLWLLLAAGILAQLPPTRAIAIWPLRFARAWSASSCSDASRCSSCTWQSSITCCPTRACPSWNSGAASP